LLICRDPSRAKPVRAGGIQAVLDAPDAGRMRVQPTRPAMPATN